MTVRRLWAAFSPSCKGIAAVLLGLALAAPAAEAAVRHQHAPVKKPVASAKHISKSHKASKVVKTSKVGKASAHQHTTKYAASHHPVHKHTVAAAAVEAHPSFGEMAGLHAHEDPLDLKSSVALVIDQDTNEVLFSKNDHAVLPIASLTKLMTGLIISQAHLPMDEPITITEDDVDTEKNSRSRLAVGTTLTRRQMLHLALMSSENRAAHALGRTYPGGLAAFVTQMNVKARLIGMSDTRYVEPTGLSSKNQSSALDLAALVNVAHSDPLLREFTTSPGYEVEVGRRTLQYNNTNRLVKNPNWDIGLQKTGYITEAGRCMVLQTQIAGRKLIMVFLDSAGTLSRIADAQRVRAWVETRANLASSHHLQAARG